MGVSYQNSLRHRQVKLPPRTEIKKKRLRTFSTTNSAKPIYYFPSKFGPPSTLKIDNPSENLK